MESPRQSIAAALPGFDEMLRLTSSAIDAFKRLEEPQRDSPVTTELSGRQMNILQSA
jgi:hypothetical protein